MSDFRLPQNTLVIVATGEEAKLFRMRGAGLRSDGHWKPEGLAYEGPSGKSPSEQSEQDSMQATFSKQVAEQLYALGH